MLRHLLLALAAVFGALALAILVLPYLVSSDKIRADLTEQLARSTGYRIDFGGNVALRGIPALR
ncbi:MAG: hypothetical protein KDJ77_11515, partial [Rhodobiaceae bacterium]|nr:hypothetical protein [Rhodobiaceae bacterium]